MTSTRHPISLLTVAAGVVVVVSWASAFPAIRVAVPELGVVGLSLVRLGVAAVALLARAPFGRIHVPARRDLPLVLACGFFGMAAYQVLLNWGEVHVPAGTASIIVSAAPLVSVAIAAGVFGERLTATKVLGSTVAIAGVVLVSTARSDVSVSSAVLIVIAAGVVQGIYHPLTKPLLVRYSGVEVATYGMVAGVLMTLPLSGWALDDLGHASADAWWAAIYLGVIPSALGFVMWGYAVARLPVITSTSLLYLVPAVAIAIAYVWLGEVPLRSELVGGLVVIAGVAIVTLGDSRRRPASPRSTPHRATSRAN
ncbi:DMT family transporter [Aeromicrobium alkaliterrae]|uniref:DMT family transporter n=1 Tax=Aeromicrobium alkaliterrae TaxID=302168 RepID=A0ABN2K4Y5_9ACTN